MKVKERAIGLFSYLQELARLKVPFIRDCKNYEQVIWFNDIPDDEYCFAAISDKIQPDSDDCWIRIKQRKKPDSPSIPDECKLWVDMDSINKIDEDPKLFEKIPTKNEQEYLYLDSYPRIKEKWRNWVERFWRPWAEEYGKWQKVRSIYQKFFVLDQELKRRGENYELILGVGLLLWKINGDCIYRHLLESQASISFDPDRCIFTIGPGSEGARMKLETDMITDHMPSHQDINDIMNQIKSISESPCERKLIEPVLKSLSNLLSSEGTFVNTVKPLPSNNASNNPQVVLAPAIILRKRSGYNMLRWLESAIQNIKSTNEIPVGIHRICEIVDDRLPDTDDYLQNIHSNNNCNIPTELYFPLPYNDRQKDIANKLEIRQGVLVQGPPGTGKSHTIANLVCHLLAHGKRILITSQTPRALKVLKQLIPSSVSPLCVCLLGNDKDSRDSLEESVNGISNKHYDWDKHSNREKIKALEIKLDNLRSSEAELRNKIRQLREKETYTHQIPGTHFTGTAQNIAKNLTETADKYNWIPDDIPGDSTIPLSSKEFNELVLLFRELSPNYCHELKKHIIPLEQLPCTEEFLKIIELEKSAHKDLENLKHYISSPLGKIILDLTRYDNNCTLSRLKELESSIGAITRRPLPWIPTAVYGMLTDHDLPWRELQKLTSNLLEEINKHGRGMDLLSVKIPESADIHQLISSIDELLECLGTRDRFGFRDLINLKISKKRTLISKIYIDGKTPDNASDLRRLLNYFENLVRLEQLWKIWGPYTERINGPYSQQITDLEEQLEALNIVLDIQEPFDNAKEAIKKIPGLPEPSWHEPISRENYIYTFEAIEVRHRLLTVESSFKGWENTLALVAAEPNSHDLNKTALDAIRNRDMEKLSGVQEKIRILERDRRSLSKGRSLFVKLSEVMPKLAREVERTNEDPLWDSRAPVFDQTWEWSIASKWLEKFNKDLVQIEKFESQYNKTGKDITSTISELAALNAWMHCFERMTEEHRQHLVAWKKAVAKIGKGTGKYAEKHRSDARSHMKICQKAIPAWIMPLYRVIETVEPLANSFDVVIVDEASQCGPEGIILFYLGKQCVIVGDDQQISPEAVGIPRDKVHNLAELYLKEIPHKERLDVESSIFDLAEIKYGGRIPLQEHFRCMPEIIKFSNDLCYVSNPLIPLRQYPPERLEPVITKYISDGYREGDKNALNKREAEEIANSIVQCCQDPKYAKKTMGVISLLGETQAKYIERLLIEKLSPEEMEKRKLICGDAYAFQGDERDIIFLSMVVSANEKKLGTLTKATDKRRFNVAFSRARDQVWLFHSVTINDLLNKECMRYRMLHYCLHPIDSIDSQVDLSKFQSVFEQDVYRHIISKGYYVIPQYEKAGYSIDLVIMGHKSRLAVECDGDKWHGPEQWEKDWMRQRVLERCGETFLRIRGSSFYRDQERALYPLWKKIEEMGIQPNWKPGTPPVLEPSQKNEKIQASFSHTFSTATQIQENQNDSDDVIEKIINDLPVTENVQSFNNQIIEDRDGTDSVGIDPDWVGWVSRMPSNTWLKLAQWVDKSGEFMKWECTFLYEIKSKINRIGITPKQAKYAKTLYEKARSLGYRP